jgi:hypothetical protein
VEQRVVGGDDNVSAAQRHLLRLIAALVEERALPGLTVARDLAARGLDDAFYLHRVERCRRIKTHQPIRLALPGVWCVAPLPDTGRDAELFEGRALLFGEIMPRHADHHRPAAQGPAL